MSTLGPKGRKAQTLLMAARYRAHQAGTLPFGQKVVYMTDAALQSLGSQRKGGWGFGLDKSNGSGTNSFHVAYAESLYLRAQQAEALANPPH